MISRELSPYTPLLPCTALIWGLLGSGIAQVVLTPAFGLDLFLPSFLFFFYLSWSSGAFELAAKEKMQFSSGETLSLWLLTGA